MGGNIILFVLGNLFFEETEGGRRLPDEVMYRHDKTGDLYPCVHINEAAVKHLIREGFSSAHPVNSLVYLCSKSRLTPIVPAHEACAAIDGFTCADDAISIEDFFLARIAHFCANNGFSVPDAVPLPFNPLRPADSLSSLMDVLKSDTEVSIDITGGQRDAAILLTLAAQIIKMATTETSVGEILYTNYEVKTIFRQNSTFGLIDLVNAIDAFIEYGRADQLKEFFDRSRHVRDSTRRLSDAMEAFSGALALCQPKGIERKVLDVQRFLDEAQEQLGRLKDAYLLCTSALELLEDETRRQDLRDTLGRLNDIRLTDDVLDLDDLEESRLPDTLEAIRQKAMMNRSELLCLSLIPAIRERFVRATTDEASLTLELIKWCANHQMAMQALCIFRERIGRCLLMKGYFVPLDQASQLTDRQRSREVSDLPMRCSFKSEGLFLNKPSGERGSAERRPHPYFAINQTKERQLRLAIVWFSYLHETRNTIVHVDGDRGSFSYFFALEILGKDRDEKIDLSMLCKDIVAAVEAIEHPRALSDKDWRKARSAAFDDLDQYRQRTANA